METIFGLFAKHPIPGRVKTRLAADIGSDAAAKVYSAFLTDLVGRFHATADRRVLAYSPSNAAAHRFFESLAGNDYKLWAQPDLSLGERMSAFFLAHLPAAANGHDRQETGVVLIGSDSPTLPQDAVDRAFLALQSHDCVIGPVTDGGFCLIGLRRWTPGLFDAIEWGGPRVLAQTVRNLSDHKFTLHLLPPWYDVDTLDDLQGLRGHLAAMIVAGQEDIAPQTRQIVKQIIPAA